MIDSIRSRSAQVEDTRPTFAVTPGDGLIAAIDAAADHGAPTWRVPLAHGLQVPRLSRGVPYRGRTALTSAAWVAVNVAHPVATDAALDDPVARTQLLELYAAAARDVAGVPVATVERRLVLASVSYSDRSSLQRLIRRGRITWCALDAWPWAPLGGTWRRDWWLAPLVADELWDWTR